MPATEHSMPLFDAAAAERARDDAISDVQRNADKFWMDMARGAVRIVAGDAPKFTTDAVWKRLGAIGRPRDPRAMGAVMTWAVRAGICRATGEFVQSAMVSNHGRPIRVWESLMCQSAT